MHTYDDDDDVNKTCNTFGMATGDVVVVEYDDEDDNEAHKNTQHPGR